MCEHRHKFCVACPILSPPPIQLVFRFYDLNSGDITLENHDINALNVPWVRSKLSIVSQVYIYIYIGLYLAVSVSLYLCISIPP